MHLCRAIESHHPAVHCWLHTMLKLRQWFAPDCMDLDVLWRNPVLCNSYNLVLQHHHILPQW